MKVHWIAVVGGLAEAILPVFLHGPVSLSSFMFFCFFSGHTSLNNPFLLIENFREL